MKNGDIALRKRIALNIFSKYINIQAKLHELKYLFWECTKRCNIKCQHCGSDCSSNSEIADMPADKFLSITADISKVYKPANIMIVLTGGEPMLREDLEFIGRELSRQGFLWGMVTNGFMLTPQRFDKLLKAGLKSITVSLDGMQKSHNWLRGKENAFTKAVAAIKLIANAENLVYDVATCIHQNNISELEQIKQLLINLKVKRWRLFTIDPIGRAKDNTQLNISEVQFLELMNFIKDTRKETLIKADYGCEGFLGNFENTVRDGYFFCRAGINIASILVDGSIAACPNNSRKLIQGNVYNDNFIDVWNNKFEIMRNREWAKTGKCIDCEVFKWCRGNGLHLRDFENNEVIKCHYHIIRDAEKLIKIF